MAWYPGGMNEHQNPDDLRRFNSHWTMTKSGCHEWNAKGGTRPTFWHDGKFPVAARWIYWYHNGVWPVIARHTCNNDRCVNPEHIIDGSHADNMRDKSNLTPEIVAEIRRLFAERKDGAGFPYAALAAEFGIGEKALRDIVMFRTWTEEVTAKSSEFNAGTHHCGRRKSAGASSSYKGVGRDKTNPNKPWAAYIKYEGKKRRLGRFATEEEAARAYDAAAREMFGSDKARFNFPEPGEQGIDD